MEKQKKEVAVVNNSNGQITERKISGDVSSVESFITTAIQTNVPIETLEKLLAMRGQVKAEQAKEAFINAMSSFQAECPIIAKNKDVNGKDGKKRYSYASLDSIVSQVKGTLGKFGLAYTPCTLR